MINLALSPLRERRDDVPLLAFFFLKKHSMAMGKEIADISPEAMRLLSDYAYPGNVRELANIIERGGALAGGPLLELQHLPDTLKQIRVKVLPQPGKGLPTLDEYEAEYIRHILEHTRGNRSQAADILCIDRVSL